MHGRLSASHLNCGRGNCRVASLEQRTLCFAMEKLPYPAKASNLSVADLCFGASICMQIPHFDQMHMGILGLHILSKETCLLPRSVSQLVTADLELDAAELSTDDSTVRDEMNIRLSLSTT